MGLAKGTWSPLTGDWSLEVWLGRGKGTMEIDGAKVFSATKFRDRENLGAEMTNWLQAKKDIEVLEVDVRQSSDNEFHCLSIVVWYRNL